MTLAGAELADRLLEVLLLDVASFRASSRALEAFAPLHLEGRIAFVVNRAARSRSRRTTCAGSSANPRSPSSPSTAPSARLDGEDDSSRPRSRTAKRFDRLAAALVDDSPHGEAP